jgi:hypothetical protein
MQATQPLLQSPNSVWLLRAAIDTEMNGYGRVPLKLYLWTLKFKFHIIFTHHKILFFL